MGCASRPVRQEQQHARGDKLTRYFTNKRERFRAYYDETDPLPGSHSPKSEPRRAQLDPRNAGLVFGEVASKSTVQGD